jgi:hypothetical protein
MVNSVIRSDGTVVWAVEWSDGPRNTVNEIDDDLFSAYRTWYEAQRKEDNGLDAIPVQIAS